MSISGGFKLILISWVFIFAGVDGQPLWAMGRRQAATSSKSYESKSQRLIIIGDIMVHGQQLAAAHNEGKWDFEPQLKTVKPLFKGGLAVGNLETVFGGNKRNFTGFPAFNTPDGLAPALAELGLDMVMLANNHILDQGLKSAVRSTKILDEAGIFWTGLSPPNDRDKPLIIKFGKLTVAFVNFTYGSNSARKPGKADELVLNVISEQAIISSLKRAAKHKPDVTVAYFHWGSEYQFAPTKTQKRIADLCLENGVDLVIGSHPHVIQPIEIRNLPQKPAVVAYSLGNFISFQRKRPRERSLVLAVDFIKTKEGKAAISRVSAAPIGVYGAIANGRRDIRVLYSGRGGAFNDQDITETDLSSLRLAGQAVLDFLGASAEPDKDGFYTLWEASTPAKMPEPRRKTPL
jgi:poly-gamma-glutamate synthesis protein (capsule biosynthesis protein)